MAEDIAKRGIGHIDLGGDNPQISGDVIMESGTVVMESDTILMGGPVATDVAVPIIRIERILGQ